MNEPDSPPPPLDPIYARTVPFGDEAVPEVEDLGVMTLEVLGGPMDGLTAQLDADRLSVGRAAGNDLVLTLDSAVSKQHAQIRREGGHFWLEDLGSSNGTWMGDQRIQDRVLIGPGSSFSVGQTRLEFGQP